MNLLGYEFKDDLQKFINPDNLEKKYGGNLPDKEENFFPPELV